MARTYLFSCSESEKDKWLDRTPPPGPGGKTGHYEADQVGSTSTWAVYIVTGE